nr:MAG TPA: putative AdoMet-dependent methyltransferase [Caudoviricetes sp.]
MLFKYLDWGCGYIRDLHPLFLRLWQVFRK